jgi:hypothetical protein
MPNLTPATLEEALELCGLHNPTPWQSATAADAWQQCMTAEREDVLVLMCALETIKNHPEGFRIGDFSTEIEQGSAPQNKIEEPPDHLSELSAISGTPSSKPPSSSAVNADEMGEKTETLLKDMEGETVTVEDKL